MLLISMTRSLIKLDNTVEAKLEDINMTNRDDYTNVHNRTNTNNHKDDDNIDDIRHDETNGDRTSDDGYWSWR